MEEDIKELKDCFIIHCIGEIDKNSYDYIIKKFEQLESKALNMHVVSKAFNNKHTPNYDIEKCTCKEHFFKSDSVRMENEPEAIKHFINDILVCYFKH